MENYWIVNDVYSCKRNGTSATKLQLKKEWQSEEVKTV